MQRNEFIRYLESVRGLRPSTAKSRAGNCQTIEKFEGDLDALFAKDGLEGLRERLAYGRRDQRDGTPARHSIPIKGDIYNGTATLRSALSLYIDFKNGGAMPPDRPRRRPPAPGGRGRAAGTAGWPQWEQPSEEDSLLLARILAKHARFLSPAIIEAVARDNDRHQADWRDLLSQSGIDADLYLWDGSPCAFPGVRRHAGSREISRLRNSDNDYSDIPDALCIDDNDYPKQVWSFAFRSAPFSKVGPSGYRLAHLFDHKLNSNRMSEEVSCTHAEHASYLPGLYTCPSNTAYVPEGLLLPTDFNAKIRNLLQRRAARLYKEVCMPLPDGYEVKDAGDEAWALEEFPWAPCVGGLDYIDAFLEFRRGRMDRLISQRLR